jgi:SAM-dependent methyltransferase
MHPVKLVRYAIAGWLPFGSRHCVLCDHDVWRFMPYGRGSRAIPGLMLALDIVGSDVDHFECPHCGAHDRERHLLMYLQASGLLAQMNGKAVLHFAPEKRLSRRIVAAAPARHVRCDLYPQQPDMLRVDMLAMQFESASFDFLIANHVLEHVADDRQALQEIRRVLKPGGYAILQTPYSRKLHRTWQDDGIDDDAARLQAYGQADHVRLFGRDIFDRFASTGLVSRVQPHAELLPGVDACKTGVNPAEPFFLFQRMD